MIPGVKAVTILRCLVGIGSLLLSCGVAYAVVPAAPTNLAAIPASASQINLSWTDNSNNETSFKIERKTGSGGTYAQIVTTGANFATLSNTGLTAGTTYFYRVRASNSSGNSAYSNEASAIPVADTTAPIAPTGLTATSSYSGSISLSWTASTDNVSVTGYSIEHCQGAGCSNFALVQVWPATQTAFADSFLINATSYSYRIRAGDAAGNMSPYSAVATATTLAASPSSAPPTIPASLTATAVSASQINLRWIESTSALDNQESGGGVAGYLIERCQGANCGSFVQVCSLCATGINGGLTTFNDSELAGPTNYSYRVRALDISGVLSAYSTVASTNTAAVDSTPPTGPTGLTGTAAGPNQINLNWTASTDNVGVTGYQVQMCTGAGCTSFAPSFLTSSTPSLSAVGLAPSTSYGFQVLATDAAGNLSAPSDVVSVTTASGSDTTPPTSPSLTAVSVGPNQINLTWTASTDNVGVSYYDLQRCWGVGCTSFLFATEPSPTFTSPTSASDTGLVSASSLSYRVRAVDAAGNRSAWSNVVTVTTQNPDTTPPTTPSGLTLTPVGPNATQIDLSWTASSDNVGVEFYHVERCPGVGCTNFVEVATPSAAGMSDYGLASNVRYSYRVRATDVAGNLSAYSNVASLTTSVSIDIVPTGQGSGGGVNVTALTLTQGSSGSLSVTISPPQATDSAISITSSTPGIVSVPASVVIPAGSTSAVLVVTAVALGSSDITASFLNTTSTAQVVVNAALGASVDSSVDGSVVGSSNETLTGTFSGPSNTGITVNGVVAAIVGNTFVVPDIPLQPGTNTLTIVVTTPTGQTSTSTVTVNSSGPAPMEVTASPAQGTAPLAVAFTVNNRTGNAIQSVQADYLGTGSFVTVSPNALSNNYTVPGVYQAKFTITDSTGATFQQTVPIAVQDPVQIDQMLRTTWTGFTAVLAAQNTAAALQSFNAQAQAKYGPVFGTLLPDLPQIVASFSALQLVSISGDIGEYAINRTINGVDQIFFIYFLRDADGVWRLDSM